MTDDAKEWVTVKVEKPVRDDAQEDPRTYTEIMRAGLANGQLGPEHAEPPLEVGHQSVDVDDLREQLDRIESAAKEATNAAQSADRKLEDLR